MYFKLTVRTKTTQYYFANNRRRPRIFICHRSTLGSHIDSMIEEMNLNVPGKYQYHVNSHDVPPTAPSGLAEVCFHYKKPEDPHEKLNYPGTILLHHAHIYRRSFWKDKWSQLKTK